MPSLQLLEQRVGPQLHSSQVLRLSQLILQYALRLLLYAALRGRLKVEVGSGLRKSLRNGLGFGLHTRILKVQVGAVLGTFGSQSSRRDLLLNQKVLISYGF